MQTRYRRAKARNIKYKRCYHNNYLIQCSHNITSFVYFIDYCFNKQNNAIPFHACIVIRSTSK